MIQFTARLPGTIEVLRSGVAALSDPADALLDWAEVRDALLAADKRSAAKALAALPKTDRVRVVETIDLLCDTPAAGSALKG